MCGAVIQQPLVLPQAGAQPGHLGLQAEAWAQRAVFVQALQPLRIAHVGLATRHVFGVPGVDQHHLEPALLQAVQVLNEGLERPHRLLVAVRTDSGHVHSGAGVDGRRSGMNRRQVFPSAGLLRLGRGIGLLPENNAEGLGCGG